MDYHFLNSSYREKLIEHLFVGELLKLSWANKEFSLEVSKPEVDNSGYDLIAEARGYIRHIQLKTAFIGAKTASQKVHTSLAKKPSGMRRLGLLPPGHTEVRSISVFRRSKGRAPSFAGENENRPSFKR